MASSNAYRHQDITWEEFSQRYRTEMLDERPWVLAELQHVAEAHPNKCLWVLCWERLDDAQPHCHRTLLVEMLRRL